MTSVGINYANMQRETSSDSEGGSIINRIVYTFSISLSVPARDGRSAANQRLSSSAVTDLNLQRLPDKTRGCTRSGVRFEVKCVPGGIQRVDVINPPVPGSSPSLTSCSDYDSVGPAIC